MSTGGPEKRTDGEMDRLTDRLNRRSAEWSQTNLEIAFLFTLLWRIADQKYCYIQCVPGGMYETSGECSLC